MDQPGIEIYVVGAFDTHAHAMPPSCHKHQAVAVLRVSGFCTGPPFLRVARLAVRFIDLIVADLTFAGRPAARSFRMHTSGSAHQGFGAKEDWI